jgi:arylsulfatase
VNFSVRNQRWRYVGAKAGGGGKGKGKNAAPPSPSLFDMEADPGQTTDVLAQHPEVAAEMLAAYEQYWKEARPLMVNEEAPMSPTKPYHEWFAAQKASTGIPKWVAPAL